ncbi:MAG: glycosyltransferase family 2 protein [Solirubrobacterales bacterium]
MRVRLSYCVVNTGARELLLSCLEAIERTAPPQIGPDEREVLVLDNASADGSVAAVREHFPGARVIELSRRRGKAENDSTLLREARGEYCLLLNEDSELLDGAAGSLVETLDANPSAAVAGPLLLNPDGSSSPCAWRLPGAGTALSGALFLHRALSVQSGGEAIRSVGWVQSSAMLVRRAAAEQVGWLDPRFFVYSDETDFEKRLRDAGHEILYVPAARAIHHDQMASDATGTRRRIVEFHRNRDLYLRKHHGHTRAALLRPLHAFPYLLRAVAAAILPGHSPRRYLFHARRALAPRATGEGIREAAEAYNKRRGMLR